MKLIKRLLKRKLLNKTKVAKKTRKMKKILHILGLCCAFCAGATVAGVFVYKNRQKLAVMTVGKRNIRHRRFLKTRA